MSRGEDCGKRPCRPTKPGLALKLESERDITRLRTPAGPGHAATIALTTLGAILAAWWSGRERAPETDLGMSRLNPVIRSPRRELRTRANLRRSVCLRRSVPWKIGESLGKLAACAYIPSI